MLGSARNGNFKMPVYLLKGKSEYTVRKMDSVHWYEIQEQKNVPVRYTGIHWPISSNDGR
jgi:hypothetical protein